MDKYTKIENTVLEALIVSGLTGVELKCFLFMVRKINGFHKEEDEIALSQFVDAKIATKKGIVKALKKLQDNKMVIRLHKGSYKGDSNLWKINKDVDKWENLVYHSTLPLVYSSPKPGVLEGQNLVYHSTHTKDKQKIYTKEQEEERERHYQEKGFYPLKF